MSGQTNLSVVLKSLKISCDNTEYGFATVDNKTLPVDDEILGTFKEAEGLTIIAEKDFLQRKGMSFEGSYAKLTIDVYTSLELVGLTAVLASKLAENKIPANVVAGYFHDHIFVQYNLRKKAIEAIESLKAG